MLIGGQVTDRHATATSCGAISLRSIACAASRMERRRGRGGIAMIVGRRSTDVLLLGVASARM